MESKRKKARLTPEDDDEEDRLSRLSDDVIHIIMSYLDIKLSVQTCVLSKRWKLVWTTLPYLKFKNYYQSSTKFSYSTQITAKFVAKFLKHRNHQSQISSLKLMLLPLGIFARFLQYANSHRVKNLNVHLRNVPYKLCGFNSNSIQKLKLKIKFEDVLELDCWDLPALKTLHLTRIHCDHSHHLSGSCLTSLPALRTLCLTDWDLEKSDFSFSLPGLITLRLVNCKLPDEDWNFPALKSLVLHDVVFPWNIRVIFAALVSLRNLTLFFYKTSMREWVLTCPKLVNLDVRTRYYHKIRYNTGKIVFKAPKLKNFTSGGMPWITFKKSKLVNVYVKLKGWTDDMILPRETLKKYYEEFEFTLLEFTTAKILHLDSETIEALSSIMDYLAGCPPPFCKLKYVKLPLGFKEENISSTLRSYLLGGSPAATIVTTSPWNNMISNPASANVTAQNVVIHEPLAAPTKAFFDSESTHETVCLDTVDTGVPELQADRVKHVGGPVEGSENYLTSSSVENSDSKIWLGHEVNSEFACLLDLIMDKHPETFEQFTTTDKKLSTMKLNMLCTSVNVFTKISMTQVDAAMIAEYRDVFAGLQKFGFNVSWLVSRLNYIEQLRISQPLLSELYAIDCDINSAKSKLKDLEILHDEKMKEIQKTFGTMGTNLVVGCIGDDLLSAP